MMRTLQTGLLLGLCLFGAIALFPLSYSALQAKAAATPENIDANQLLQMVSKNKGKVVVVNIFASWCPPCREEVPGLIATRKAFEADKVLIVGVSVDKTTKALQKFMQELPFNYPVYIATGNFVDTVGVTAIPQLLVYNKAGELVINHKGLVTEKDLKDSVTKLLGQ